MTAPDPGDWILFLTNCILTVKSTGKSLSQIEKDTDRNYFMSAQEAQEYGIVDKVLESRKDSGKSK